MLPYHYAYHSTPIGVIRIKATEGSIHEITFTEEKLDNDLHLPPVIQDCISQIDRYFAGELTDGFSFAINPNGTPFQYKIWELLREIPYGHTITYQRLAELTGEVKNTRAVANAVAKNPLAIVIPCHRVLGSNGSLTGYAWGIVRKQWLIDQEAKKSGRYMKLF